jgi:mycothiol synthase
VDRPRAKRYPNNMSLLPVDIVVCPPELRGEAVALVLSDIAPSQRSEIARDVLRSRNPHDELASALFVALREGQLRGAAWGQLQPGNTAVFWPPRLDAGERASPTAERLTAAVLGVLDKLNVAMSQVLLPAPDAADAPLLEVAGFRYFTDLVYLTCERHGFPASQPDESGLEFVPYDVSQRERLAQIAEKTYEGTHDFAALGSERNLNDVIDGYMATGRFDPSRWFVVRASLAEESDVSDVGVLLLAEHPDSNHFELIYMGLAPASRGRGWGRQIIEFAKWIAYRASAERIVCAVDAVNRPGLTVYRDTGFRSWDRRSVFLRFLRGK